MLSSAVPKKPVWEVANRKYKRVLVQPCLSQLVKYCYTLDFKHFNLLFYNTVKISKSYLISLFKPSPVILSDETVLNSS